MIEVLVVVAIIALLISILLPSLAGAREQAKVAACAANQHQIGLSLRFAFNEYKAYPSLDDGNVASSMQQGNHNRIMATWIDTLVARRYLGNLMSGYCPKDEKPDAINFKRAVPGTGWNFRYPPTMGKAEYGVDYSYGISAIMASYKGKTAAMDIQLQKYESSRVLAADGWWNWLHGFSTDALKNGSPTWPLWGSNTIGWRHGTRAMPSANVLFVDSSVRNVRVNPGDLYPDGIVRGLSTGDKYFWRSAEHTEIGWGSPYNTQRIHGGTFPTERSTYPEPDDPNLVPDELRAEWYTVNGKWPASIVTHKGWNR